MLDDEVDPSRSFGEEVEAELDDEDGSQGPRGSTSPRRDGHRPVSTIYTVVQFEVNDGLNVGNEIDDPRRNNKRWHSFPPTACFTGPTTPWDVNFNCQLTNIWCAI